MDRIMPIDLDRTKLRKRFRGYETEEVDEILKVCARTIEALLSDVQKLKFECERLKFEVEAKSAQEDLLKETLMLAQKSADETRAAARAHADAILGEARQLALSEHSDAHQKVSELRWEIERLRNDRKRFADDFRAILEGHLRGLSLEPITGLSVVEGDAEQIDLAAVNTAAL
jgi:cell division initiation protein